MSGRFDVFHSLEQEKKQRIVDAALTEFAEKGYKRASTNAIAENAHIGKGMLFYYFGSKEELFDFICEYTIEFARDKYFCEFQFDTGDFVERCKKLSELKRTMLESQPKVVAFYESIYRKDNDNNTEYFAKYGEDVNSLREQLINRVYSDIDYSLFREDINGKAVVTYIKWLFDAYQNDLVKRFANSEISVSDDEAIDEEWTRYDEFIANVRKLFYK